MRVAKWQAIVSVMDEIMSTADAAKRLGYTTARINQLIQVGRIDTKGRLSPRGAWLVSRASVERFAELKNKRIKK